MALESVSIARVQQANLDPVAEQMRRTQQQIQRYVDLLRQDNLTPGLRVRIENTKRICEAALIFQHPGPHSMTRTLLDLDNEINKHWQNLYRSPSTFMLMSKDMADLRHFLARCLNIDYGCSLDDFGVECWPTHAASQYGRYLRNPKGYNRSDGVYLGSSGYDEDLFAATTTFTVSAEACIDTAYALKQLRLFKERDGNWKPLAPLLAREGRWGELAEKILEDKALLPHIYSGITSTQPLPHHPSGNPGDNMYSNIVSVQCQYFWRLSSPDNFSLTKRAKALDRKRRLDGMVPRQLVGCRQKIKNVFKGVLGALTGRRSDGDELPAYSQAAAGRAGGHVAPSKETIRARS